MIDNKTLYLVPTPIGNMEDITMRAINVLKNSSIVLAEDTRVSSVLLKYYKIDAKLISYHKYNEDKMCSKVKELLDNGNTISLISDQGSPVINDPGYILVKYLARLGYNVVSLPGATAFVPAIMSSAIDARHFIYYGFLNNNKNKRRDELQSLKKYPYPIVFYEAPHRINSMLSDMLDIFGDRIVSVSREISKVHEEVVRGRISEVLNLIKEKGEFVIVVEGDSDEDDFSEISISDHVKMYINDGDKKMDAIKKVAKERGVKKSDIYKEFIDKE